MKKLFPVFVFIFFACRISAVLADATAGEITGVVNHCDKGGVAGMMVYIPGMPHLVITGTDGKFQFTHVPVGDYTIYFMLNGKNMNFNKWTEVSAGQTTKLGELTFCDRISMKKSAQPAVTVAQPATPAPASTAPASATIPANLKDHCRNENDGTVVGVINGKGVCQGGKVVIKQCNKGFSDCDKKAVNGCEIDIMNDDANCGACGNACADMDSCQLGFC